jgi:hypothetical protein
VPCLISEGEPFQAYPRAFGEVRSLPSSGSSQGPRWADHQAHPPPIGSAMSLYAAYAAVSITRPAP